jgi:hypothetical protein
VAKKYFSRKKENERGKEKARKQYKNRIWIRRKTLRGSLKNLCCKKIKVQKRK